MTVQFFFFEISVKIEVAVTASASRFHDVAPTPRLDLAGLMPPEPETLAPRLTSLHFTSSKRTQRPIATGDYRHHSILCLTFTDSDKHTMDSSPGSGPSHAPPAHNGRQLRHHIIRRMPEDVTDEPVLAPSRKRRKVTKSPQDQNPTIKAGFITVPHNARTLRGAEAGPSNVLSIFSDPSEDVSKSLTASAAENPATSTHNGPAIPGPSQDLGLFREDAQLRLVKQALADAQAQLQEVHSERVRREGQIRQDMYFETLRAKETARRDIEKLDRQLRTAAKVVRERVCRPSGSRCPPFSYY